MGKLGKPTHMQDDSKGMNRFFGNTAHDVTASLVVFLTALPLSMGIAIASGAPASWGLFSAIIGGLVGGLITGVPLQIHGPAAGLIVICWDIIQQQGVEALGPIVCAAGILQFLAGKFKWGQLFRAISPAIVQGMLAGIGLLIVLTQFHVMVDHLPKSSGLENLIAIPEAVWEIFTDHQISSHTLAAGIGIFTISALVVWRAFVPKAFQVIPAPLVAVLAGTWIAQQFQFPIEYIEIPNQVFSTIPWPDWARWPDLLGQPSIQFTILAVTFISSSETLLTSTGLTKLTRTKADYDGSLLGLGVSNICCGLLGILPISGVIIRSAINVEAGAKTKKSSFFLGIWIAIFLVFFPHVLSLLPTSCLAAILVYTGFKLINVKELQRLWGYGYSEAAIFGLTVGAIVVEGLLTGIIVGLVLTLIKTLYIFSRLDIYTTYDTEHNKVDMYLEGSATFMRLPKLATVLEDVPPNSEIHIHIDHLDYIDHACLELLMSWEQDHLEDNGRLILDWDSLRVRFQTKRPSSVS